MIAFQIFRIYWDSCEKLLVGAYSDHYKPALSNTHSTHVAIGHLNVANGFAFKRQIGQRNKKINFLFRLSS